MKKPKSDDVMEFVLFNYLEGLCQKEIDHVELMLNKVKHIAITIAKKRATDQEYDANWKAVRSRYMREIGARSDFSWKNRRCQDK